MTCRGYLDNLCKAISEGVKVSRTANTAHQGLVHADDRGFAWTDPGS